MPSFQHTLRHGLTRSLGPPALNSHTALEAFRSPLESLDPAITLGIGHPVNEAAVVAAGFPYRRIRSVDQMPECFSRPICRFAMGLNDKADDEERQRLLPFVTRLACADTPEVERKRSAYVSRHSAGWLMDPTFEKGLKALEGALAIGRQADPLGPDEVQTRMEAARAAKARSKKLTTATARTSAPDKPSSKVECWLSMKETEPAA